MNGVETARQGGREDEPPRRVRQDVRDGVAVVAFSAVASSLAAVVLVLLTRLAG